MQHFNTALRRLLLILTAAVMATGVASAQNEKIVLSNTHMTVGKAMNEIQEQTSYKFAFNMSQLDTGMPVRFAKTEMSLSEALSQMFDGNNFKYVVRNRFIAVSPNSENPERANVVAKAQDNEVIVIDPSAETAAQMSDSHLHIMENRPYEIERTETIIPAEPVDRNYPQPYSSYHPVDRYGGIQKSVPTWAVKTNLLYGGLGLAPNLGIEVGVSPKGTVELTGSFNDWDKDKSKLSDTKQLRHWFLRSEYRWWSCERYNGHFFGAHAFYSKYNVSGRKIPMLFDKGKRYDGWAMGAGATYGYSLPIAKQWNVEFHVGFGVAYMRYDKFSCEVCDRDAKDTEKIYVGPTRAGISISFMIK